MDFINIKRILHTPKVKNSWPSEVSINLATPSIAYTYDIPLGRKIFNYRQTIDNLDIQHWLRDQPNCNCTTSNFCDSTHGHIITSDLNFITNPQLKNLLKKDDYDWLIPIYNIIL